MSVRMSVYVGPYLKCVPSGNATRTPPRMIDLLMCADDPGFDAFGIDGDDPEKCIVRQLEWDQYAHNTIVDIKSIQIEMAVFEAKFAHEIRDIRGDYTSVEVCWGVVAGMK